MRSDSERCLAAGMNDHLPKPFDKATLLDKVRRWGAMGAALHAPRACTSAPPLPGHASVAAEVPGASATGSGLQAAEVPETQSELRDGFSAQVAELSDLGDLAFTLAEEFAGKIPGYAEALCLARNAHEASELSRLAHDLTGSAGTLGFQRLSATARRLQLLACRDPGQAEQVIDSLLGQLGDVASFIASAEFIRQRDHAAALGAPSDRPPSR
jgi:two-component system, sensor histidine kinase and response regulator